MNTAKGLDITRDSLLFLEVHYIAIFGLKVCCIDALLYQIAAVCPFRISLKLFNFFPPNTTVYLGVFWVSADSR